MELISGISLGVLHFFTPDNILLCFAGVFIGTFVGVIPGLGSLATLSILLPITFYISSPLSSIVFLAGVYYGSQYGGSISSILLNLPGEPSSVITTLDGYPMTKNNQAGSALSISVIGSFIAGTISTFLIIIFGSWIAKISLIFGPVEYTMFMIMCLLLSVIFANNDNFYKSLGVICIGILLGLIGIDNNSGQERFTFGLINLYDGLQISIVAMGVFGLGEILYNFFHSKTYVIIPRIQNIYPDRSDIKKSIRPILRGTVIGSILGFLPGVGPLVTSYISYYAEKYISKTPEKFGKGAIEGVAAPESANNAASQTNFVPTLALGLPTTPALSIILAVLIINGIAVGPTLVQNNSEIFWGLIVSMWVGNLFLLILNLPLIGLWVSILKIPQKILFFCIIIICFYGAYIISNDLFGFYVLIFSAILGYVLKFLNCDLSPLIIGFLIGRLFEEYFRRSLMISDGSLMIFIDKPISFSIIILTLILISIKLFLYTNSTSK